jgi:2Fe-2S ferredoxin
MVKIVIENLGQKELVVTDSTSPNATPDAARKPVLRVIQESGIDWMTDCGGKGRCTTCRAIIISGGENLTPESPAELRYRSQRLLYPNERLMCQTRLREATTKTDLVIRVPDDSKLPHLTYS